jgi:hypothetical protein
MLEDVPDSRGTQPPEIPNVIELPTLLLAGLALAPAKAAPVPLPAPAPLEEAAEPEPDHGMFAVRYGPEMPELRVPNGEVLEYQASVDLGLGLVKVGKVTLTSGVESFQKRAVILGGTKGEEEQAWMRARARGNYVFYSMDTTIESRQLPQQWPRTIYLFKQSGTEHRIRETTTGIKDEGAKLRYRDDTGEGGPAGAVVWSAPVYRDVPENHYDMLSAVYAMRAMILDGGDEATFPVVDKDRVWVVNLKRGGTSVRKTKAGKFQTVQVLLQAEKGPDEPSGGDQFKGLFGLSGAIEIYVDEKTGVPVQISGDLPLGFITLGVEIKLRSYSGTPEGFAPIP